MKLFAGLMPMALPSWLKDEGSAKLFFFATIFVALLLVGRWISARSESSAHDPDLTPASASVVTESAVDSRPAGPDPKAPIHPELDCGPVILRKLYFSRFDALTGPADALNFFDEVTVEVYFKESGGVFQKIYTVATPLGFSQFLEDKNWDIFYTPEMFVVQRYDLKLIREAIIDRLVEDSELGPADQEA